MITVTSGVVHGKTIELADDPQLAEGEKVEVTIRPLEPKKARAPGDGIRKSAGAIPFDPKDDEILAQIYRDRKNSRRPEAPE
jgi:hypothetical protein